VAHSFAPTFSDRESIEAWVLNFFAAILNATTVTIWAGKYPGPEATELMRQSCTGLVTWRDRDDGSRMYVWNPTVPLRDIPVGFKEVTVSLDESPPLFQRLINDAVKARMCALGFLAKSNGWVNYNHPSLMAKIPALAGAASEDIGVYPKIVLDVFFTRNARGQLVIGLVVDILYTTRMEITAAEWVAAGLAGELRGTYVTMVAGSTTATRYPEYSGTCIGMIDTLRDDRCILTDLRDTALAELPLTDVAPEPTYPNLARYLGARYQKAYEAGQQRLIMTLRKLVRPQSRHRLSRILVLRRLQSPDSGSGDSSLTILPGVEVCFADMAKVGAETFPVRPLADPEYSFDRSGGKYARRVDDGLKRFGPYDAQLMRGQPLRLLVVALEEHKGEVELAIQKLLKGIPTNQSVFTGLTAMYRLDNLGVTYAWAKVAPGAPMKRYADALHQALQSAPSGTTPRFHMLLTVINASHRDLPDSENPYFQTKVIALIQDHVPTQAITIEKLRQSNYDLQFILNTMALSLYAKLGGTSHVLKLPTLDADAPTELVFGIGRSIRRIGRFDKGYETVGFATVFRANGEYLYNSATPYCDDMRYERALEDTIRRTVETVADYEGLPEGAPLRLIFHVPRRPGRHEEHPILNAVGKLTKFKIEFALVHVNDDHHFHLFDTAHHTPKTLHGQLKPEAMLLPARGFAVTIGPRERLVTFIGVDQYRGYGCPAPLRITLDARSTFRDIDYVTQQLYLLSFMSARSLNPGKAPATITYAEQLADLTGHLRGVQNWTVELIHQYLGRKLWFI
jgi:hypothetical protein